MEADRFVVDWGDMANDNFYRVSLSAEQRGNWLRCREMFHHVTHTEFQTHT